MSATHEVVLPEGLRAADTARLCAGVAARLRRGDVTRVLCRVDRLPCDLGVVDALARLHLTARRAGASLSVHRPSPDLQALLELLGLAELLGPPENEAAAGDVPPGDHWAGDVPDGDVLADAVPAGTAGPTSGRQTALHHVDQALPELLDQGGVE